MIKNILLLNPPDPSIVENFSKTNYSYFEPPLGLLYIYSFIKNNRKDFDVRIVDLNIELGFKGKVDVDQALNMAITDFSPDLIGISAIFYSGISIYHLIVHKIKQLSPSSIVVLGGHYPTHLTEMALEDKSVDYAVLSEGELGLCNLIDSINENKNMDEVEGIAFKNNSKIVKNIRQTFWKEFSDFPMLEWKDLPMKYYFSSGRNFLTRVKDKNELKLAAITATRGCPNECTFCSSKSFWKRNWRKRKISNIIKEINFLIDCYDVNTIVFNDENIGVNRNWFFDLLCEIEELKITWISGGGLSIRTLMDEELIKKMYKSGIGLFNIAIESSSDETLSKIKKPSSIKEIETVINYIRANGNGVIIGFFITGFPFESLNDIQRTYSFAESLDLDWKSFYCFQPFPGSELYDYCINNRIIDSFDVNYAESYFAPQMKYIDYTSNELNNLNYIANLRCNFVNNRNLIIKSTASLQQAERDFRYVLDIAPKHVFALLGLAEIMRLRNNQIKTFDYIHSAKKALNEDMNCDWQYYLSIFKNTPLTDNLGVNNV